MTAHNLPRREDYRDYSSPRTSRSIANAASAARSTTCGRLYLYDTILERLAQDLQDMPIAAVLSTKVLHSYRIFAIVEQELRLPSGRTVVGQVVQHPGAVVIIPQLEDGRLILIEQYRFAVGQTLLEFLAGTLEAGEAPLECATRELLEETGYRADHWRALGMIYPSPGYCDEQQHLFVATGLVPDHAAADEDEILKVKGLTVQEVERAIADGALVDAKSIAAYVRAKLQGVLSGMSA